MENLIALVGFILPPLIDLINNKIASKYLRFWVSVLVCALVGTGVEWVIAGGVLTPDSVSARMLFTFGLAQLSYGALWNGSKADTELKTIQGEK